MKFVDVHAHINAKEFDSDREEVLLRAEKASVLTIFDSGLNFEENNKVLELSEKYKILKPCFGFEPAALSLKEAEKVSEQITKNQKLITAVGEIGLDFWRVGDETGKELQKKIFEKFVELAIELDKPIITHSRSAGKYVIAELKTHNAKQVCMHAFDGSVQNALEGVELGFYFSIPPSVVRSEQKQKLVKALPLENLLLESDSPVLAPNPKERNEPANVKIAAEKIAELKGADVEEVAQITTRNAKGLLTNLAIKDVS